ncbi:hypothetical protein UA08_02960 [Talaromyces atroroseus]|uniref:Uncharacterized protein n=1 Tax=Talaromyces atroroseus TaxID=1441469 RepID=A0A225B465_TALAT|nr:hypothetical protein UA08_02960 [Talaromyces atroroseus]OKL62076.1 hypothetical protein UA08_02960 [Talaromyces atroroseus]
MSDTEQEWKPNPRRPQSVADFPSRYSTMAQAFSLALDSAFMLDSDVDQLTQSIEQKKQRMTIQTRELEALQARIREAEERLKEGRVAKEASTQNSGDDSDQSTGSAHQQGRGENELARALSPTSSALSDENQSDEGATDSDTSAATSNDMYEPENGNKAKSQAP